MEFNVPKRHTLKPTLSVDMVHRFSSGRGTRSALVEKGKALWHRNIFMIYF